MRFKSFTVENFKGIESLTLNLSDMGDSNIFTLVGLNESGKTTILEAINMLQNDIPKSKRHNYIPRSQSSNFNGTISVSAQLALDDGDEDKIKKYALEKHSFILEHVGETLTFTKKYSFKKSEYDKNGSTWSFVLTGRKSSRAKKNVDMHKEANEAWNDLVNYLDDTFIPRIIYYPNFLFDFPEKIYLEGEPSEKQDRYLKSIQDILDSLGKSILSKTQS